jgi:hypothetical protein
MPHQLLELQIVAAAVVAQDFQFLEAQQMVQTAVQV